MSRLTPDQDRPDAPENEGASVDPEPRREQQRAQAERHAAEHAQRDSGRHDDDRSRPSAFKRKMH